ncbi:MAG TPA: hypothetical protein VGM64_03795 [Lacunisphaera sp.]|jgi:hypothetical protein
MNAYDPFRTQRCRIEINFCLEIIAQHELAAANPPESTEQPEFFTSQQLQMAEQCRQHLARLRDELGKLEGQFDFFKDLQS